MIREFYIKKHKSGSYDRCAIFVRCEDNDRPFLFDIYPSYAMARQRYARLSRFIGKDLWDLELEHGSCYPLSFNADYI